MELIYSESDIFWGGGGQHGIFTDILESLRQRKLYWQSGSISPADARGRRCLKFAWLRLFGGNFACGKLFLAAVFKGPWNSSYVWLRPGAAQPFVLYWAIDVAGRGNRCSHWSQSAHLSERIITSCFAFCLYGTWLLRVSVSGLARGARLWRTRSEVTAAAASAGAFDSVGPPPHL